MHGILSGTYLLDGTASARSARTSPFMHFTLILLKILQWIKDKKISLDLSIRALALQVRRQILIERITVKLNNLKIQFKQNILDTYLEQLWA
jgi:hypothetical protein